MTKSIRIDSHNSNWRGQNQPLDNSNDGKLADTDLNLADEYQSMFDRLNNECQGPIFERQYKIGKIIPLHSEKNDTGNFSLSMQSKFDIKMLAEDIVMTKTPYILILASCYSHRSEVSNILRSSNPVFFDSLVWYILKHGAGPCYFRILSTGCFQ